MQFIVPQFIERKPKIIGPFTFWQFSFIAGALVVSLILFFFIPYQVFIVVAVVLVSLSALLAFAKIGRYPIHIYLKNYFLFSQNQKTYIWKKK